MRAIDLAPLRGLAVGFVRSRRANFATLTALTMPLMLMFAAFAVDEGSLYSERRELQALADIAALTSARNIPDRQRLAAAVLADHGMENLAAKAVYGADRVGSPRADGMTIEAGVYTPDPARPVSERFALASERPNAVRVELRKTGTRYFSRQFMGPPSISASAVASLSPQAAFSVGSRLARLDAGILNNLLGALTGSAVSLSLMDYEALAKADVRLFGFLEALRSEVDLTAGGWNDFLESRITLGKVISSLARSERLAPPAIRALDKLDRNFATNRRDVRLSSLFDLGTAAPFGIHAGPFDIEPRVGLMELLSAAAFLSAANREDQITFGLEASSGGLLSATVSLGIGEPPQRSPWFRAGPGGGLVRTAQTRLLVELGIGAPGGLLGNVLRLPLYLELASAEAKAVDISCPTGTPASLGVSIAARPGIATLRIADPAKAGLATFQRSPALAPGLILALPPVRITGSSTISVSNRNFTTLSFDSGDIAQRTIKRVATNQIAESLAASLLANLHLEVDIAGISLVSPAILKSSATAALAKAAPAIDSLLNDLLAALGIALGEADIRIHGATCGRPVLVQ